jgi:hypothetical protein
MSGLLAVKSMAVLPVRLRRLDRPPQFVLLGSLIAAV